MITKWGVKNFKSILDANLDLAPLTVFTGINSSGKSAFLHSIVMLAQSAKENYSMITLKGNLINLGGYDRIYHKNSNENKRTLTDKICINCTIPTEKNENVSLELELSLSGRERKNHSLAIEKLLMECKKDNSEDDKDSAVLKYKLNKEINAEIVNLIYEMWQKVKSNNNYDKIEWSDRPEMFSLINEDGEYSFLPDKLCFFCFIQELDDEFIELLADLPPEELTDKKNAQEYADNKITNLKFDKRIVKEYLILITGAKWYDNDKFDYYDNVSNPYDYDDFDDPDNINYAKGSGVELFNRIKINFENLFFDYKDNIELADWYQILSKQNKQIRECVISDIKNIKFRRLLYDTLKDYGPFNSIELPEGLKNARDHLYNCFKYDIEYLGPLREDPAEWNYEEDKNVSLKKEGKTERDKKEYALEMRDVGVKGERTPFVVNYLNKNYKKTENYYSPDFFNTPDYKPRVIKFVDALEEWLKYIEISDEFETIEEKDKYFEILIGINGQYYAIPQLGTGVSQVVPILVMCLSAPVGSTLIIEQPELHLHPKMQSRLADFFITMALSGRQCLIETHSEYIIYMIRYRISKSLIKNDKSIQNAVKLLYAEKENNETKYHEINVNKHGELSAWPEGFFDERQKLSDMMLEGIISDMDI